MTQKKRQLSHFLNFYVFLTVELPNEQGIAIIRGVDMDARMALSAFASQALADDPSKKCTHHAHEEGHSCADHSCQK